MYNVKYVNRELAVDRLYLRKDRFRKFTLAICLLLPVLAAPVDAFARLILLCFIIAAALHGIVEYYDAGKRAEYYAGLPDVKEVEVRMSARWTGYVRGRGSIYKSAVDISGDIWDYKLSDLEYIQVDLAEQRAYIPKTLMPLLA